MIQFFSKQDRLLFRRRAGIDKLLPNLIAARVSLQPKSKMYASAVWTSCKVKEVPLRIMLFTNLGLDKTSWHRIF